MFKYPSFLITARPVMQAMTFLKPKQTKVIVNTCTFARKFSYFLVPHAFQNIFVSSLSPGAHSDKDWRDDDDGHGAAILSLRSHVKLMPVMLSNTMSVGKLRSRQPTE